LLAYYAQLVRWNAKINLTALHDPDAAIDRLLLEPVAAAALLPAGSTLMDLGSGGGSPAIPLALGLQSPKLIMVESKGRKAAFLREAARTLGLPSVVEATRFEDLSSQGAYLGSADIVSIRAVRMDEEALEAAARFLRPQGILALFVSEGTHIPETPQLRFSGRSSLSADTELLTFAV
jgi:16S rRNA (guanine527-N7)-methyltransferase